MTYIKTDEFVNLCYEADFDISALVKLLDDLYPGRRHRSDVLKQRIANYRRKGLLPLDSGNFVSHGEQLKSTSTLYDASGAVRMQWIKSDTAAEDQLAAFERAVERIVSSITPIPPSTFTGYSDDDILVKIPIADAHIGLLTWHKEVNVDFDMSIAQQLYTDAITRLVVTTPSASTCLLLDLGDTIHTDDQTNQTKGHKHQLDVDGRYDKLYDMSLHILCTMIDTALTKYPKVIFRKTRGNHDGDSSIGISAALAMRYRDEPRVSIERSPSLFWWYQFGRTLHFSTHGHTVRKQSSLPEIAAHDCKSVWSTCDFVYIDTGHVHHQQILETRTAVCESHNSLTAGDSFNYGHGYRSLRNLKAITYHKTYGEIARSIVSLPMLSSTVSPI